MFRSLWLLLLAACTFDDRLVRMPPPPDPFVRPTTQLPAVTTEVEAKGKDLTDRSDALRAEKQGD